MKPLIFSEVFSWGHAEKTPRTGRRHFSAPRFPLQSFCPCIAAQKRISIQSLVRSSVYRQFLPKKTIFVPLTYKKFP